MIAGGSGVTPCYDVAREVLQDPADNTRMSLVYANKHEEDIWLRKVRSQYCFFGCYLWYSDAMCCSHEWFSLPTQQLQAEFLS